MTQKEMDRALLDGAWQAWLEQENIHGGNTSKVDFSAGFMSALKIERSLKGDMQNDQ